MKKYFGIKNLMNKRQSAEKAKIIVILGPTSSGKTELSIDAAKKFKGEIISADSRQVYKELKIGTGKITKKEMKGVPHHLLGAAGVNENFTVQDFKESAEEKIEEILRKKNLPIIVGGTGFYIRAIVDGIEFAKIPPNQRLRKKLKNKDRKELFLILKKMDEKGAKTIDRNNSRRLIRAIEIAKSLGKIPKVRKAPKYEVLQIGLDIKDGKLKEKIRKRINEWFKRGLIKEGEKLKKKINQERFDELGLEYGLLGEFLRGEISREKLVEKMNIKTFQYVKRQRTWFRRDKKIKWFKPDEKREVFGEIKKFLDSK